MAAVPSLAAFDLDGTLLNRAKAISDRNLAALRALTDAGCVCVLASGRMFRDCMEPHLARLGLETPVIAYNGAMVLDAHGGILYERPLALAVGQPILDFARATARSVNCYHRDVMYCPAPSRFTELYERRVGAKPVFRDDFYEFFRDHVTTKILIFDDGPVVEQLCAEWQARVGDTLYVTTTEPEYLEFMDPRVNKGAALRALCERLGRDVANTAAFGDAANDLPLLRAAGVGYAMANSRPSVLAQAARVAPHHDEDGVAQVIEGWLDGTAPWPGAPPS